MNSSRNNKRKWNILSTICLLINLNMIQSQNLPRIPCPEYFRYQMDGGRIVGIIEIKHNSIQILQPLHLHVGMSIGISLQSKYLGSLELIGTREEAYQRITQKRSILYKVNFPNVSLIPKLMQIIYNKRLICSGPPVQAAVVTTINLQHTLVLRRIPKNQTSLKVELLSDNDDNIDDNSASDTSIECGVPAKRFKSILSALKGVEIERGSWPWLTAIYQTDLVSSKFLCSGNLISFRIVVTAAHCFAKNPGYVTPPNQILIQLGRFDRSNWQEENVTTRKCSHIFIHEDYKPGTISYDADVAVCILEHPIKYTDYIRPICLWGGTADQTIIPGLLGTIVGWGRTESNQLSPTPKISVVPIVDETTCLRSNEIFIHLTSNRTLCAGDRSGTGPCSGDSGGGLAILVNGRWTLRGTVSAALAVGGKCDLSNYVVYCDLAQFIPWIQGYM